MSLYKEFSSLLPYLQSVRKLEDYLSFDVSFPVSWKILKRFVDEEKVMEQPSKIDNERMFSFVTEINEESVSTITKNIQDIIKHNLEREEKEKLFQNKVDELKNIFEKQNLNNLKNLSFELKTKKIKLDDEETEENIEGVTISGK
jgi:cysteinyl-tRNA synthetase